MANITPGSPMNNGDTASASYLNNWMSTSVVTSVTGSTAGTSSSTGMVGEIITNSATGLTCSGGTTSVITSCNLTAGSWDITGFCHFPETGGTTPVTSLWFASSSSSTQPAIGQANFPQLYSGAYIQDAVMPTWRFLTSANATSYMMIANSGSALSNTLTFGYMRATRVF